jgi:hypothetical protein
MLGYQPPKFSFFPNAVARKQPARGRQPNDMANLIPISPLESVRYGRSQRGPSQLTPNTHAQGLCTLNLTSLTMLFARIYLASSDVFRAFLAGNDVLLCGR